MKTITMCFALALAGASDGITQAQAAHPAIAPAAAGSAGVLRVGT